MYAKHVYQILEGEFTKIDAIYEDYILMLVGLSGLMELKEHRLIEACGNIQGRQLYTLCDPIWEPEESIDDLKEENKRLRRHIERLEDYILTH